VKRLQSLLALAAIALVASATTADRRSESTPRLAQRPGGFPGLAPGGFPGGAPGGFPGFTPGGGGQLVQQPGLLPGGGGAFLPPGQSIRLALFCADLFAATPDHRTRLVVPTGGGQVRRADGSVVSLHEALEEDQILIRGRGPGDPPRMDGRAWYDAYVTNTSREPLTVELPAGLVLVPAGQPAPKLPAGIDRMLAAAAATRRREGDAPAYAVWAARGFTRADVEQTTMRRVTDGEASQVQHWLDAASLAHRFDREADAYDRLYASAAAGLSDTTGLSGTASLSSGATVRVAGRRAADGRSVVTLTAPRGGVFRYAARVDGSRGGKLGLALHHLKTGRPIEANGGHIWIALDSRMAAN
jgi:hypothetical protein